MTTRSPSGATTATLATVLALALVVLGCAEDGSTTAAPSTETTEAPGSAAVDVSQATYDLGDFTISGPTSLPAGATAVTARNLGVETHHLVFARLEEGQTPDDFFASFARLDTAGVATLLGGPNGVAPGDSVAATLELAPGDYVLVCVIPGPDGVPHFLKGMFVELTVEPSDASTELPSADRTVHLGEYQFGRDGDELEGFDGTGAVRVTNEGAQLHELTIVRIRDDSALDDVIAAASIPVGSPRPDPLPYEGVGGASFLSSGASAWIDLDDLELPTGRYALVCFIPSPDDRVSHAEKGMVYEFDV